jgi:lipoprotein-releasing system ATP-binding protein
MATAPGGIVLQARGIRKSYETGGGRLDVLTGIDLDIHSGEILAILGASGVGKSTLLHILGTLDRPTAGRVLIEETDVFALPEDRIAAFRNRTIGFVFQAHHLLPEFTAIENVMMPLLVGRQDWQAASDRAASLLHEVGLGERMDHKPAELSGGEQQRVAVARALACQPRVVLADEPSGNLDRFNGKALLDMIWTLNCTYRQAFVIVTHDEGIGRRADRTFLLTDGHLDELTGGPHP